MHDFFPVLLNEVHLFIQSITDDASIDVDTVTRQKLIKWPSQIVWTLEIIKWKRQDFHKLRDK